MAPRGVPLRRPDLICAACLCVTIVFLLTITRSPSTGRGAGPKPMPIRIQSPYCTPEALARARTHAPSKSTTKARTFSNCTVYRPNKWAAVDPTPSSEADRLYYDRAIGIKEAQAKEFAREHKLCEEVPFHMFVLYFMRVPLMSALCCVVLSCLDGAGTGGPI